MIGRNDLRCCQGGLGAQRRQHETGYFLFSVFEKYTHLSLAHAEQNAHHGFADKRKYTHGYYIDNQVLGFDRADAAGRITHEARANAVKGLTPA